MPVEVPKQAQLGMIGAYLTGKSACASGALFGYSKRACLSALCRHGLVPRTSKQTTVRAYMERFATHVTKNNKCWEWTASLDKDGYGICHIQGKARRAHRVAWETEKGPIPKGFCVLHKCDNRKCVRVSHLFLGTRITNNKDRDQKGRSRHGSLLGELHGRAKLTAVDVKKIRRFCKGKRGEYAQCARRFGVSAEQIRSVVRKETWRHL